MTNNDEAATEISVIEDTDAIVSVVGKANKAAGNPIGLLLGPVAKVFGNHLASKAQAYLDKKQQKNLDQKVENVLAARGGVLLDDPTPTQFGALIEWSDAAKNCDETLEPNLAKAWELALNQVLDQNYDTMRALTQISERQILLLSKGGEVSNEDFWTFAESGIIEPARHMKESSFVQLIAVGLAILALTVMYTSVSTTAENLDVSEMQIYGRIFTSEEGLFFLLIPIILVCISLAHELFMKRYRRKRTWGQCSEVARGICRVMNQSCADFLFTKEQEMKPETQDARD